MAEVKKTVIQSAGMFVKELEFSKTANGMIKLYKCFEKQFRVLVNMLVGIGKYSTLMLPQSHQNYN